MADFKLVNENGTLLAKDPTTGNTIPLDVGNVDAQSLSTENLNNEVYAAEFAGAGLASKVDNALTWLANNTNGRGRVRVTPKDDGTAWTWDTDLVINDSVHQGVHLDIDNNVEIDYPGNGTAITLDGEIGEREPTIEGGVWSFSGDPEGWLRIQDTYGTVVSPTQINGCWNANTDAFGVSVENHEAWTENTRIRDCYIESDKCIQFLTAADTGGSGTDSFHETKIQEVHLRGKVFCIKTKGNFKYSVIQNSTLRPDADGANCLFFDHRFMSGGIASALKFEDAGTTAANDTAFYDPDNTTYYGPMIIEPEFLNITNKFEGGGALHRFRTAGGQFQFDFPVSGNAINLHNDGSVTGTRFNAQNITVGASGSEIDISGGFGRLETTEGGPVIVQEGSGNNVELRSGDARVIMDSAGVQRCDFAPQDVTQISSPQRGWTAYNNGTVGTEGPAFYNGTSWVSQVDGTTIS